MGVLLLPPTVLVWARGCAGTGWSIPARLRVTAAAWRSPPGARLGASVAITEQL